MATESRSQDALSGRRVAVVGGGVSGLSAAWRLAQSGELHVALYEAQKELGGVLQSERRQGYLIERSADMFTSKDPWALDLCRELGIEDELVSADEDRRRAFVVRDGKLHQVPQGFVLMRPTQFTSMLRTPLLSWRGKLRLFAEPFIARRKEESDESLQSFVTRRLGAEVFQRIVQPLVGGIYTADPEQLSMAAAMPTFAEMERKYGCLLRAPHAKGEQQASGARYAAFVAPKDGMQTIPLALTSALEQLDNVSIQTGVAVENVARPDNHWRLTADGVEHLYDGLVLAGGARTSSQLLQAQAPELSDLVGSIPYASAAVVVLGVNLDQIQQPVEGFGFVVPAIEGRRILAVSFASHKFPGRAPDGKVLIRVFIGGALQPELLDKDDPELIRIAREELGELIGLRGEPQLQDIVRWRGAMPQYHVGHVLKVDRIEALVEQQPHLALAGNAFRGVGVPFCIRSGAKAAERIISQFQTTNE